MPEQPETGSEISELSFEAALKRLEEIVRKLESGEASLDESIELYAEGDRLKRSGVASGFVPCWSPRLAACSTSTANGPCGPASPSNASMSIR